MTPIVVMHVCEHFGGQDASLHGVARAFQWWLPGYDAQRFRVLLCSRKGPDKASAQMEQAGLSPHYLNHGKHDPRNLTTLLQLARREGVDILHAHGFGACLWARLAGKILRIPVICHGRANYRTVPPAMRPVEALLGPSTRFAFAVSESTRRYMIDARHMPEQAVKVLYNGILPERVARAEPQWIADFRRQHDAGDGTLVIGICSRIVGHKGHLEAFEAFERVLQTVPDAQLWVIGDGDFMPELERWVAEHDRGGSIRLLGFRQNAIQIMQCLDVQLFPSHLEGTPNTLYEGMTVGNAIVASTTDGQGEVLEEDVTALLFTPGDVDTMARQLLRVLTDTKLRQRLAAAAAERAADFDGRLCIARMEAAYAAILSDGPSGWATIDSGAPRRRPGAAHRQAS